MSKEDKRIRELAHQIWESEGKPDGAHDRHWEMARKLAEEKGRMEEFEFMERIEKLAVEAVYDIKGTAKKLCANVDFYSGFVYDLIGLPIEIYTPLFAMARIVGWCAHRNEELNFEGKRIIRPAYKPLAEYKEYVKLENR